MEQNHELVNASCTSKAGDNVLYNSNYEVEDEASGKEKLKTILKTNSNKQLSGYESDEDNFVNLILDFSVKENVEESVRDRTFVQTEDSTVISKIKQDNIHHCFDKPRNLTRSVSVNPQLNRETAEEITSKYWFNDQVAVDNPQTILELQEQLVTTTEKLKQKTRECETLTLENQELRHLVDPVGSESQNSLLKRMWGYSSVKKKTKEDDVENYEFGVIKTSTVTKTLSQKIIDYKIQLQQKDKEIADLQAKNITQKQYLKQSFCKKTEVQKEILEDMELRCKNMEAKLNVEKKLREERETEISHIHSYLNKKETYFRNQIDEKDTYLKRVEANYNQEIKTMGNIINQKDEEISQVNRNYNQILDKFNEQVEAVNRNIHEQPLDVTFQLKEIKMTNLEQSLELKRKHLHAARMEINKLQEELTNKHQELEKALSMLSKTKEQDDLTQKLQSIRDQISEILNVFHQEHSSHTLEITSIDSNNSVLSQDVRKRIVDKEEVD